MQNLRKPIYQLLRQSESFFKTDMVYLTKGNFWLFLGQAVAAVSSLVLAIAFANLVTPEEYGNYKYVFSVAGIINAFSLSGLGITVMRASSINHDGTLKHSFRQSLTWGVVMVTIAGIACAYYFIQGNNFLGTSLIIVGVTSPLILAASLYRPFLYGKGRFKIVAFYSIIQSAVPTFFVLIALLFKLPILVLVAVHFFSNMITLWLLYLGTTKLVEDPKIDPATDRLSKHLSIMGAFSTISGRLDSVLVFQLLGGAELAIFSLAVTIPDMIRGYFKNITSLAMPKFAQKTKEEMKLAVWSKIATVIVFTSIIALLYIWATPYIFRIFFPQYLSAIPYSQVYAISIITTLLLASAYFDSQVAVKERYILNVVINGTTIATTIVGIYFFGLWGAIFARIVTRIVNVSLAAFLIARH